MTQSTLQDSLRAMRRPRLLVQAARHGLRDYDRHRVLRRILGADTVGSDDCMAAALAEREAEFEEVRKNGMAGYNVARHLEILIALMAEARLLAAASAPSTVR